MKSEDDIRQMLQEEELRYKHFDERAAHALQIGSEFIYIGAMQRCRDSEVRIVLLKNILGEPVKVEGQIIQSNQ